MWVKREGLKAGYVLTEDVYGKTSRPIMKKDTVLTDLHLKVLDAFLIEKVMIGGKTTGEEEVQKENTGLPASSFIRHYLSVVDSFQSTFRNWQSGDRIDMKTLRRLFIPLLEEASEKPDEIFSLHYYVEARDYLFHHAVSTAILSAFLAKKMGYEKGDWVQIGLAGALCDCGMARVPLGFLKNKGPLSDRERKEIRQHPIYGFQMLKTIPALQEGVRLAVSQHHERENGSGYPLGIDGSQIHPFSKIVAVADSFHAMTCDRPYRAKRSPFQALEIMTDQQFGRFDLNVLATLSAALVHFSVGTKVRLTDQRLGEIVFIPPRKPTRPMVRMQENGEIIPLADRTDLSIESIIS
ncbi:MAG TPA: HD-GYP domain-containing protein [Bacillales bacterium]|nr:HD-GYP domain-containing protein [Bacillales bacterium]